MKKTLTVADHIHTWYENKAKLLGIPVSTLMIVALSDYMKQDSAINSINDIVSEFNKSKEVK